MEHADPLPGRWSSGDRQQRCRECDQAIRGRAQELAVQCLGQGCEGRRQSVLADRDGQGERSGALRVSALINFSLTMNFKRIGVETEIGNVETCEFVIQRVACGQHQHWCGAARFFAQFTACGETIHAGYHDIHDDHAIIVGDRKMELGKTVARGIGLMAFGLEVVVEIGGEVAVVFND